MNKSELYRLTEGDQVWTLTSADAPIQHVGEWYEPATIGRNEAESKNEMSRSNLEVTLNIEHFLARRFLASAGEQAVGLTVFSKDDLVTNVVWKGRLSSVKPDKGRVKLVFESVFTSLRRPGLRARYQRACRHNLYGPGCGLNKENFATTGMVTQLTTTGVVMPAAALKPNGYYTGGMIEGPDGAARFILEHNGSSLTLSRSMDSLIDGFNKSGYGRGYGMGYGGLVATIYPGCPRTREVCDERFSNLPNFGGFPAIPLRNPFDGSSIV